MKTRLLKLALPIGVGLLLFTITLMGLLSTTLIGCQKASACSSGAVMGTDGKCYGPCPSPYYATLTNAGNCGSPSAGGVYCCGGGSTSGGPYCNSGYTYNYSSQQCCPNATPYYYPGTHGISPAGCYASCPYVGDCGTMYTKY